MTHFHLITLFPESIEGYFNTSMLKRAQRDKKIKVSYYNPRDFTKDKHKRIDQKPYGGGPGMVLEAESVLKAARKAIGRKDLKDVEVIFFSPSGKQFEQKDAVRLAKKKKHIVFLCGHYEGIDARAVKILKAKSVSVGPFVLTGGELPAALVADAVTRNIEGVLGNAESLEDTRVASPEVYTRPEILKWKGKNYKVPKVLLSGHHAKIEEWKKRKRK
ncbi:tRNA (guanosine(37)-N1)-methyltransferase TrmD [Candidatus Kaiserbacteria bacterium]|nr:MAG: tRNA (guanosine(37)-N1)-methyltransferase TrmD [Candidatus Kaiserbacteria bacterium]